LIVKNCEKIDFIEIKCDEVKTMCPKLAIPNDGTASKLELEQELHQNKMRNATETLFHQIMVKYVLGIGTARYGTCTGTGTSISSFICTIETKKT